MVASHTRAQPYGIFNERFYLPRTVADHVGI
jgi:hypothetical protein